MQEKNIIIASGPVIIENGKVLLNKHGDDEFWKFPGGKIEQEDLKETNNTLEEGCKRKAKQEMGIIIEIIKPLRSMLLEKPNDPDTWVVLIHYLAKRLNEIEPGPETKKWNWFSLSDLPNDCAPNIRPVIYSYLKNNS